MKRSMAASFDISSTKPTASKTDVTAQHKPIPRYGHTTNVIGDKMLLWCGGQNIVPIAHNGKQKETFACNIETLNLKSGKWEHRQARGYSPGGIQYYSMAAVDKTLYHFGGHCGHSGCYYSNLTKLDTTIYKWDDVRINNIMDGPIQKYSCGMAHFKCEAQDYLFIVGGYGKLGDSTQQPDAVYTEVPGSSGCVRTNEMHIFDITKECWINPTVSGDRPPPCSNFTFNRINSSRAILFGGTVGGVRSNNIYVADFAKDSVHWTKIPGESGSSWPSPRTDHATELVIGRMQQQKCPLLVMTGGIDDTSNVLDELWIFTVEKGTWLKIDIPSATPIVKRAFHSISVLNIGTEHIWLIVFGGAVSWEKGKSAREQELVNSPNVIEIGWSEIENSWKCTSIVQAEKFSTHYTSLLKERL